MLHFRSKENPRDLVPLTLLFFDRYNAGDPLFVADVARRIATAGRNGMRTVILHASDDAVDQALEAAAAMSLGVEEVAATVERAVRMTNQSLTRRMIDEGVSAVSIQGNDRGLLRIDPRGAVTAGRTEWLERSISLGGTPVISLLAERENGQAAEADAAIALARLVEALSAGWEVTIVYFTTNRKSGLFDPGGVRLASVTRDRLSDFDEVPDVLTSGGTDAAVSVVVTNSAGIGADGVISGTRIT